MDMRVFCKLCDEKHLAGQHNLDGVKVRPWLQGFTGPAATEKPRTSAPKSRTKVRTTPKSPDKIADILAVVGKIADKVADMPMCQRDGCENQVKQPKRGAMPKFCSDACRKRASRGK